MAINEKNRIQQEALINAYAVAAILGEKSDDISYRNAVVKFSKAWIDDRINRGMLHYTILTAKGKSMKILSLFEIRALKMAEKHITDEYRKAEEIIKEKLEKIS